MSFIIMNDSGDILKVGYYDSIDGEKIFMMENRWNTMDAAKRALDLLINYKLDGPPLATKGAHIVEHPDA